MVVTRVVDVPLMLIVTGTLLPVTPIGTKMFIWRTPVTKPGAAPANCTVAGWPPMVAVAPVMFSNPAGDEGMRVIDPVVPGGVVWPPPVPYTEITLPCGAGWMPLPLAPLYVPFWLIADSCAVPCEFAVNRPGA